MGPNSGPTKHQLVTFEKNDHVKEQYVDLNNLFIYSVLLRIRKFSVLFCLGQSLIIWAPNWLHGMIRRSINGSSGLARFKFKVQLGQSKFTWNRSNRRNHFDVIKLHFCNNSTGLTPSPTCLCSRFQKLYCPSHDDRAPSATNASKPNTFKSLIGELGHHGCIKCEAFSPRFSQNLRSAIPDPATFWWREQPCWRGSALCLNGSCAPCSGQKLDTSYFCLEYRWLALTVITAPILRQRSVSGRYRYLVSAIAHAYK